MSAKHTPGPWWVTDSGIRDSGGYICHTNAPTRYEGQDERYARETEERAANKQLIAATPDLLEAAEEALGALNGAEHALPGYVVAALERAIAKATGSAEPTSPYPTGSMREGWQRGYEGRPMLAAKGGDYARAYAEGQRAKAATGSAA